ncbi:MAG: hypothetical protein GYB58_10675 [Gammaproteobacteria bacterium]|nr:hypothetical protein [Gammaproteobacteria bacterium]
MTLAKRILLLVFILNLGGLIPALAPVLAADEPLLSEQEVQGAVSKLIAVVEKDYIRDDARQDIAELLNAALQQGELNGSFSFGRLKIKLESMLYSVSQDSNFELLWQSGLNGTAMAADELPGALQTQMLDGGIGYLAVDGDLFDEQWRAEMDKAMAFLSDSKAIVVDLRSAGMSSLPLSQHFLSHFMPVGQPLSMVTFAHQQRTPLLAQQVANPVSGDKPLFIVTSPFIAGSWEFVAFTLQQADRATIVGMPTIGLGYMTTVGKLSEHLSMVMAYAELQHPQTGDSWKNSGVIPDVQTDADQAMSVALKLARVAL